MRNGGGNRLIVNVLYRILNRKGNERPEFENCGFQIEDNLESTSKDLKYN